MLNGDQFIDMMDTRRRVLSLSYLAEVTGKKTKGRVKVRLLGTNVDIGPLPVMIPAGGGGYKQSGPLGIGSRVWVFFPQANPELGFVMGGMAAEEDTLDDDAFTVAFDDGMSLVIKQNSAELRHKDNPLMTITKDAITIEKKIVARDGLEVSGDVKASGEVSAGNVKLSGHVHGYKDDGTPVQTDPPAKV